LERKDFVARVNAIGRSSINMNTARIVFTDGESHVVQTWTISEGWNGIWYYDVHMPTNAAKIFMPYEVIARVEPYTKPKMTP